MTSERAEPGSPGRAEDTVDDRILRVLGLQDKNVLWKTQKIRDLQEDEEVEEEEQREDRGRTAGASHRVHRSVCPLLRDLGQDKAAEL